MNKGSSFRISLLAIALVFMFGMFVVGSQQPSTPGNAMVFSPNAMVAGASQEDWGIRHWQWTLSFPVGTNPGQDATGKSCANGQSGPVFYLPRNFAPCMVPSDTNLLIPIVGTECAQSEPLSFARTNEDELRDCAASEIDRYTNIEVRIDGEVVPNIEAYRMPSPIFSMWLPENNVLGAPAGMTYAIADGYQVMLKPLSPGDHEIIVHLELVDGTVLPDKLTRITVVQPTWEQPAATPVYATPVATDGESSGS